MANVRQSAEVEFREERPYGTSLLAADKNQ